VVFLQDYLYSTLRKILKPLIQMKKFTSILLSIVAIGSMAIFQSCEKTETAKPAPALTLSSSTASALPGKSAVTKVSVNSPNGGSTIQITVNGSASSAYPDLTFTGNTFEQDFTFNVPANAIVGAVYVVSFQAVDNKQFPSLVVSFVVTVGNPIIELSGNLTTQTLDATRKYLLKGQVFVPSGVTLTIPAGTVILGDKATKAVLLVDVGGTLVANGTASNPIVFTSSQNVGERDRGDWGGVLILSNAWVNQSALPAIEGITPTKTYGNTTSPTTNANSNSGSLKYVRIEYAGVELTPNNETNSLTMGAVGNGTTIEYIQTSFGGDDNFEWFGGNVNAKWLVSLSAWDDDFDTDFGWAGNVQFGLAVRNPFFADQSGSNGFESDNQANANDTPSGVAGYTRGVFSNMTVLGPRDFNSGIGASAATRAISANFANGMHIRRRSAISIFNSFISGFPNGLRLDDQATLDNLTSGAGKHTNNTLFFPGTLVTGTATTSLAAFSTNIGTGDAAAINTYWTSNGNSVINPTGSAPWSPTPGTPANSINPYTGSGIDPALFFSGFTVQTYPSNPNFAVASGALTTAGVANFATEAKLANGNNFQWTAVTYRGAFGTTDWSDGWAEFAPLAKVY
jgi:hypothetical protein